jgi:hypothetical protein
MLLSLKKKSLRIFAKSTPLKWTPSAGPGQRCTGQLLKALCHDPGLLLARPFTPLAGDHLNATIKTIWAPPSTIGAEPDLT